MITEERALLQHVEKMIQTMGLDFFQHIMLYGIASDVTLDFLPVADRETLNKKYEEAFKAVSQMWNVPVDRLLDSSMTESA